MTFEPATPPVNVYESNGQLEVALPIPGAHGEHTSVTLDPERLRVEAVCKYAQENQRYLRREWQVGAWELDLELPRRVDPSGAHATLNYGVLVVLAPLSSAGSGQERLSVD
jgi:HSP20 family molecular chaperone IbpA